MYRIKAGNMYLDFIDTSKFAIKNEFIECLSFTSRPSIFYDTLELAKLVCDKIYIVLGVKCVIEKVGEKDE